MVEVVCVSESVYHSALTRGNRYRVLDIDVAKQQLRIQGDNGRTRWFPMYCFGQGDQHVPTLTGFHVDDPIEWAQASGIEVTVHFEDGERRWCILATPSALAGCGDLIDGTDVHFHYDLPRNFILVSNLSEDLIGRVLRHLESQGDLLQCTLPLNGGSGDEDAG